MNASLIPLPLAQDVETKKILKKTAIAHRYLAELKGRSAIIPNQKILINTLSLQEAKDSSAIENIITTHDELYREGLFSEFSMNSAAKEVRNYANALSIGFDVIRERKLLSINDIVRIQEQLERNRAGFRKLPGTELINDQTGKVVYTPPQDSDTIISLMSNLERFINDDTMMDADPLVKMAIIHYQFESIHPFYDGNGRTGRIINVLYLVLKGLLDIPVLYLSRHFIKTKLEYYKRLQEVRENNAWEEWIAYVLDGVAATSRETIELVSEISEAIETYRTRIKDGYRFYSQDLINNLFFHPYTKIEFLERDLSVSRLTATKYLEAITSAGLLRKEKLGRSNYYINTALYNILTKDHGAST